MHLTAENVNQVFEKCLLTKKDKRSVGAVSVRGSDKTIHLPGLAKHPAVLSFLGQEFSHFSSQRLFGCMRDIADLVAELPEQVNTLEGLPFSQAVLNKRGERWGSLEDAEALMRLGRASGRLNGVFSEDQETRVTTRSMQELADMNESLQDVE